MKTTMKNEMKFAIYCRKSSDAEDKQVQSIEDQRQILLPLARERGLNVIEVFSEARTARKPGRSEFNRMMEMIEAGKIDGVICWKVNRLSRNPIDGGRIQWLLQEGAIEIITPGNRYDSTTNSVIISVELGVANQQSRDISTDVRRNLRQKAAQGILPTGEKPGYRFDPQAKQGSKKPIPDPERFPLVQRAMHLVASGNKRPAEVLVLLNEEWGYRTPKRGKLGGKSMHRSKFYSMLNDPFYYGEFEFPKGSGNWYKGTHQTMITKADYEKIQVILGNKNRPRPKQYDFSFTGLLKCGECGASITAYEQWYCVCKGCDYKFSCKHSGTCPMCKTEIEDMDRPVVKNYTRYSCTKRKATRCHQGTIELGQLEKQVEQFLSQIMISERFKDWFLERLNEETDHEVQDRETQRTSLQAAYDDALKRLDNLLKLKISPQNSNGELLSDEQYAQQKQELMYEKEQLELQLRALGERVGDWMDTAERAFNFTQHAHYWFEHGDTEQKRAIMRGLGLNLVLEDKIWRVEAPSPFLLLKNAVDEEPTISVRFEPPKTAKDDDEIANLEKMWDRSPSLQGWRESNPRRPLWRRKSYH